MLKSCSRCGKIHEDNYKCEGYKEPRDFSRYNDQVERKLRNTSKWRKKSEQVREQAHYLCEVCRDHGRYNFQNIEAHHINKIREDQAGLLDDGNLVCLCAKHHKQADAGEIDKDYLRKLAQMRITDIPPGVSE